MKTDTTKYDNFARNKDIPRSYDDMLWIQLDRCFFTGSQDMTNTGKVYTRDEKNLTREIVRCDYMIAYINSVQKLFFLARLKHKNLEGAKFDFDYGDTKETHNATYKVANIAFQTILEEVGDRGLFGHESLVERYGEPKDEMQTREKEDIIP